jgi:hypothetical protein
MKIQVIMKAITNMKNEIPVEQFIAPENDLEFEYPDTNINFADSWILMVVDIAGINNNTILVLVWAVTPWKLLKSTYGSADRRRKEWVIFNTHKLIPDVGKIQHKSPSSATATDSQRRNIFYFFLPFYVS